MKKKNKVLLIIISILIPVACVVAYAIILINGLWEENPGDFFISTRSYEEEKEITNQIIAKIDKFLEDNNVPEDAIVYRYKKTDKEKNNIDVRYKAKIPDNSETVVFGIYVDYTNMEFSLEIEREKDFSSKGTGIEYDKYIELMEDVTNEEMPTEKLEKTLSLGIEDGGDLEKFRRFIYNYCIDEYNYETLTLRAYI